MRIVSLIASATEIVCALGLAGKLVGRSHECDFPESVHALPVCTAPKFKTFGTSRMIDESLRAVVQESLSVYRVDAELLAKLEPTHIITQTQCEVCAVSLKDLEEATAKVLDSSVEVISLQPNCLSDIYEDMKRVGTACGVAAEADALVERIRTAVEEIRDRCGNLEKRPHVALIEWVDPLMPAANWMPELVRLAGGINLFGEEGKRSEVMPWKEISNANPDVMIIAPCGFNLPQTLVEVPLLMDKQGWDELNCVSNKQIYVVDGNQFFNRPGPRVLESLQIMAEILHPELFNFGHVGKAWQRYDASS